MNTATLHVGQLLDYDPNELVVFFVQNTFERKTPHNKTFAQRLKLLCTVIPLRGGI